jgi:hypothetical protein
MYFITMVRRLATFRRFGNELVNKQRLGTIIVHNLRRSPVRTMVCVGILKGVASVLSGHKTRSVFHRYNIVTEADLARATERFQTHLEEQPKVPLVVPIIIAPKVVR